MLKKIQILLTVLPLLLIAELVLGERVYEYEVTVGKSVGYDHNTINAAIIDVEENRSSENALACIWVYPGTYEEQLHDPYKIVYQQQEYWFNEGYRNLPVNCDLQKPESETGEVKIIHTGYAFPAEHYHIGYAGVNCEGNNMLKNLTIQNPAGIQYHPQMSVSFNGYGELRNCVISNRHAPSVQGLEDMIVSGCNISTYFGPCVSASSTFSISDCELHPKAMNYNIQLPAGICASGNGTIERVIITATCESSYEYVGAGVFGIRLYLPQGKEVTISNVEINLQLTSKYNPSETAALHVCGILSGSPWFGPTNQYPGRAVVRDCKINVNGIEGVYGQNYGADIMVDGVCVRGGGTVEVLDCSRIKTNRIPAGEQTVGYEYLLNNENGTLRTNRATVLFNPHGDNPPDDYDLEDVNGVIIQLWNWDRAFSIKNAQGDAVAWFDRCGTLILTGELTPGQPIGSAPANSYIIQNAGGDIVGYFDNQGNLFIEGNWQKMWPSCNPAVNAFIIRDKSDKNVSYINFGGNLCLTGELRENVQP